MKIHTLFNIHERVNYIGKTFERHFAKICLMKNLNLMISINNFFQGYKHHPKNRLIINQKVIPYKKTSDFIPLEIKGCNTSMEFRIPVREFKRKTHNSFVTFVE